jgi:hypothetical protein
MVLLCLSLFSCGEDTSEIEKQLLGKWKRQGDIEILENGSRKTGSPDIFATLEHFEDGSYEHNLERYGSRGKYSLKNSNHIEYEILETNHPEKSKGDKMTFEFNLLADKFTIIHYPPKAGVKRVEEVYIKQ